VYIFLRQCLWVQVSGTDLMSRVLKKRFHALAVTPFDTCSRMPLADHQSEQTPESSGSCCHVLSVKPTLANSISSPLLCLQLFESSRGPYAVRYHHFSQAVELTLHALSTSECFPSFKTLLDLQGVVEGLAIAER